MPIDKGYDITVPKDEEQEAADAGVVSDKQQRVIQVQRAQIAGKVQSAFNRSPALKQNLQAGYDSVQDRARRARENDRKAAGA